MEQISTLFVGTSTTLLAIVIPSGGGQAGQGKNVAFVPLAMPIMAGPGAMATIIGMSSLVRHPLVNFSSMAAICGAIAATIFVVYLIPAYARRILRRIGTQGVDAATRIVGSSYPPWEWG